MDNNDLKEETLSGHGTTHCTNGIIIQRCTSVAPRQPKQSDKNFGRKKKRSIQLLPAQELHYVVGSRSGPPPGVHRYLRNSTESQSQEAAHRGDTAWLLLRFSVEDSTRLGRPHEEPQAVQPWSAFNAAVCTTVPQPSIIGYLPVIPNSPTELATVYELMKRSCMTSKQLNQPHTIITLDQAIYCKAQQIRWKHKEEFQSVVLRMGAFHIACTFMAVLGKCFADTGLRDLLIESGVLASNSVAAVIDGRH